MFRRDFFSNLGVLPFFGLVKSKDVENPKGLPIIKFNKGFIANHEEVIKLNCVKAFFGKYYFEVKNDK